MLSEHLATFPAPSFKCVPQFWSSVLAYNPCFVLNTGPYVARLALASSPSCCRFVNAEIAGVLT